MAEVIRMPLLSDTMKEGVIAEWHKNVGDTVKEDDVIADVETDKATMEVMPYVSGTLLYIGVEKGKGVPVNGIMAIIGKPGEDISSLIGANASVAPQIQSTAASPAVAVGTPQPAVVAESIPLATDGDERVKASPLARKMAEEKGIDMHRVHGSGDGGRIIKRDLDGFVPAKATTAAAPAAQPVASFSNASVSISLGSASTVIVRGLDNARTTGFSTNLPPNG